MELVVALLIMFVVFLFVGAVFGFRASGACGRLSHKLTQAEYEISRLRDQLAHLESKLSQSTRESRAAESNAQKSALHARALESAVDSAVLDSGMLDSGVADSAMLDSHRRAAPESTSPQSLSAESKTPESTPESRAATSTPYHRMPSYEHAAPASAHTLASTSAPAISSTSARASTGESTSTRAAGRDRFSRLLQRFTQNSLALLGGIFFILAAFFLVSYSISHALITPQVRIALTLGFGALLVVLGLLPTFYQGLAHRLERLAAAQRISIITQTIIAQTCIGSGLVVEFFGVYGGYYFYGFFGDLGAFVALVFIAAFALVLTLRYGVVIGIFGVLGSFSTPVLLASGAYHATMLFAYVLVCYFFTLSIAIRSRRIVVFLIANLFVLAYMLDFVFLREVGRAGLVLLIFVILALLGAHGIFAHFYASSRLLESSDTESSRVSWLARWRSGLDPLGASLVLSALIVCISVGRVFALSWLGLGYMDFGALEIGFVAFVCACLFALPALSSFMRFSLSVRQLSLPIPFAVLMLCLIIKASGSSALVLLGFMAAVAAVLFCYVRFADRILMRERTLAESTPESNGELAHADSRLDSARVWYLWLVSFSQLSFLLLSTQIACLDWVERAGQCAAWILGLVMFGGVYRAVAVYGLAPYRDVLLLASSIGAFMGLWLLGDDLLQALPQGMRLSLLWLASGVALALLGRVRILPREIAGFEWVFACVGLVACFGHITGIDLLYGVFGGLSASYLPELLVFMIVSAINLWLFMRARRDSRQVDFGARAAGSASADSTSRASWRVILFSLCGLLLWEIIALVNLCAFWCARHWIIGFDNFYTPREQISHALAICALFIIALSALKFGGRYAQRAQNLAQPKHQNLTHQNLICQNLARFSTSASLALFVYGLIRFCELLFFSRRYWYAYAAVDTDMLEALGRLSAAIIMQVGLVGLAALLCFYYTKSLAESWHAQDPTNAKAPKDFARYSKALRQALWFIANTAALAGIVGALVYAIRLCFVGRGDIFFGDVVIGDRSLHYEFGFAGFGEIELYTYSIAAVVLGIIMLAGYFATRYQVYRIYAFVLFGAAVLKVFFIDTSRLESLSKIALFVCMGVLFLAISYIYARFTSKQKQI